MAEEKKEQRIEENKEDKKPGVRQSEKKPNKIAKEGHNQGPKTLVRRDVHCNPLNLGKVFLGMCAIAFGFALLAKNVGWVEFELRLDAGVLIAVALLAIGLSTVTVRYWFGKILGFLAITVVLLAVLVMVLNRLNFDNSFRYQRDIIVKEQQGVRKLVLDVDMGVGSINIIKGDGFLVEGRSMSNYQMFRQEVKILGDVQVVKIVTFDEDGPLQKWLPGKLVLSVNPMMLADIDIYVNGRSMKFNIDARHLVLNRLDVTADLLQANIIGTDQSDGSEQNINAGAALIDLKLPGNVGGEINIESRLCLKGFSGFRTHRGNIFRSFNFEDTNRHLMAHWNLGIGAVDFGWIF